MPARKPQQPPYLCREKAPRSTKSKIVPSRPKERHTRHRDSFRASQHQPAPSLFILSKNCILIEFSKVNAYIMKSRTCSFFWYISDDIPTSCSLILHAIVSYRDLSEIMNAFFAVGKILEWHISSIGHHVQNRQLGHFDEASRSSSSLPRLTVIVEP